MDIKEVWGAMMDNYKELNDTEYESKIHKNADGEILAYKEIHSHEYPYVLLNSKDGKFERYKLNVLKGMLGNIDNDCTYMLYLCTPSGDVKVGKIDKKILGILKTSSVFSTFELCVYLDKATKIDGDLIFALT